MAHDHILLYLTSQNLGTIKPGSRLPCPPSSRALPPHALCLAHSRPPYICSLRAACVLAPGDVARRNKRRLSIQLKLSREWTSRGDMQVEGEDQKPFGNGSARRSLSRLGLRAHHQSAVSTARGPRRARSGGAGGCSAAGRRGGDGRTPPSLVRRSGLLGFRGRSPPRHE